MSYVGDGIVAESRDTPNQDELYISHTRSLEKGDEE